MTSRTKRYLEMYRELDGIADQEANAAQVAAMQPVWDAMSPAERGQARRVREGGR